MNKHEEGFWYSESEPHLPMPTKTDIPVENDLLVALDKLDKIIVYSKVNNITSCGRNMYKGHSPCRLCTKTRNGISTYRFTYGDTIYRYPQGLAHYLTVHPSAAFCTAVKSYVKIMTTSDS